MNFTRIIFTLAIVASSTYDLNASTPSFQFFCSEGTMDLSNVGHLTYSQPKFQYDITKFKDDHDEVFKLAEYKNNPEQYLNKNVIVEDHVISDVPITLNCQKLYIAGSIQAPSLRFNVENFYAYNDRKTRLLHPVSSAGEIDVSQLVGDHFFNTSHVPNEIYKYYIKQVKEEPVLVRSTVGNIIINTQNDMVSIGSIIDICQNILFKVKSSIHLETAKQENLYERHYTEQVSPGLFKEKTLGTRLDDLCPCSILHSGNNILFESAMNITFCSNRVVAEDNIYDLGEPEMFNKPTFTEISQYTKFKEVN